MDFRKWVIQIEPYKLAGYSTYIMPCFDLMFDIQWVIPEELDGNPIVKEKMDIKPFEKLLENISAIENYNYILSTKYLDIEKEPILQGICHVKEQCYTILEDINKNLSPYHWEIQEGKNNYMRYCLIGLFKGENRLKNKIIAL